jgi:hypothetical protein
LQVAVAVVGLEQRAETAAQVAVAAASLMELVEAA